MRVADARSVTLHMGVFVESRLTGRCVAGCVDIAPFTSEDPLLLCVRGLH